MISAAAVRQLLAARLHDVRRRVQGVETPAVNGHGDLADAGMHTYERDEAFGAIDRLRQEERQLVAALARVDAGEYGACLECGEAIALRRLQVMPAAEYCVPCLEKIERAAPRPGRSLDLRDEDA